MLCVFGQKLDGGKDLDKKTASHFEKLAISLLRSGCGEAGPGASKATKQAGGALAADCSSTDEPVVVNFPDGTNVKFGRISWESNLHRRYAFGGH